jgi:hypothetical protein
MTEPSSYSGNPAASDKDFVRYKIQDVAEPWLFTDAEIQAEIADAGNKYKAIAECFRTGVANVKLLVDKSIAGSSVQLSQKFEHFMVLAKEYDSIAKRKRFESMAASPIERVHDVDTYPDRFVHGEERPVEWGSN